MKELLVDPLLRFLHQPFPDAVTLFGRAEAKQSERSVSQAVFRRRLGEHLGGDTAGSQIDEVKPLQVCLAGGAEVLTERVGGMAGLVRAGGLSRSGEEGAVRLNGIEVMTQDRSGHIEALLGKTMHA
jgi:hypothetical protein